MSRARRSSGSDARESADSLALRTLTERLGAVEALLRSASRRSNRDPESVHKLRVATRRAAVAIDVFADHLPVRVAAWWRKSLREIRRSADAARDADVLTERLKQDRDRDASRLLRRGMTSRREAQQPLSDCASRLLRAGLLRRRCEQSIRSAERAARKFAGSGEADPAAEPRVSPFLRRFQKAAKRNLERGARLHRFRIRTKQLRYAIEIFASEGSEKSVRRVMKPLQKLQDRLGTINDHRTAAGRFERWESDSNDADERAYLSANRQAEIDAFAKARDETLTWWTGKRRKKLVRRIRRLLCDD